MKGVIGMRVKVKDFLEKWSGEWRIENMHEGVLCDFPEGLNEELCNKEIMDIKLSTPWKSDAAGEVVIIVED